VIEQNATLVKTSEILSDHSIEAMWKLQVINNGEIISDRVHWLAMAPGSDVNGLLDAVDAYFLEKGYPAIPTIDRNKINEHAALVWTPEVIAAYQASLQLA